MTVLKMAALLLAANAAIGMIGAFTSGRRADDVVKRPTWLPPLWIRGAIPLAVPPQAVAQLRFPPANNANARHRDW